MILGYDLDARTLYIEISDGKIARTREAGANAHVDLDREGWVTGIEVISIDHPWPLGAILADYLVGERTEAQLRAYFKPGEDGMAQPGAVSFAMAVPPPASG